MKKVKNILSERWNEESDFFPINICIGIFINSSMSQYLFPLKIFNFSNIIEVSHYEWVI